MRLRERPRRPYQAIDPVHVLHGILERRRTIGLVARATVNKPAAGTGVGRRDRAAPAILNLTHITR